MTLNVHVNFGMTLSCQYVTYSQPSNPVANSCTRYRSGAPALISCNRVIYHAQNILFSWCVMT